MDDQAETVLLRLARGSGVGSLRAMSVRDDTGSIVWMRPLMNCRRSETLGACRQLGLPWVDDPSNKMDGPWRAADGSALRRSAVREQAIPSLAHSLGMDPVPSLARTAELSAADDEALNEWAEQVWQRAWEGAAEAASGIGALRVAELKEIPQAVRMRVLHRYLSAVGAPSLVHLEQADALITRWSGQGPLSIPQGTLARVGKGKDAMLILHPLRLERERPRH
jgi:tRNA(ile)-lysidine synthase